MIKEIAIADAYGAGFEFSSSEKVKRGNNLSGYLTHDLYGFSGKYTDDTQMSIAIAEVLLTDPPWNSEIIASRFVACFKRDERKGYSKGFYNLLKQVNTGPELLDVIKPNSDRNGAAMRSVPIGLLSDKKQVIQFSQLQAAITHNTELGIRSSCAVALAAHFSLHLKGKVADLESFLEQEGFSGWDYNWTERVSVSAYDTVSAALSCLIRNNNMNNLLVNCIKLQGDTDSVASIAVGLAACFDEYEKDLPENLISSLDEDLYGISFLDNLDKQLGHKFRKNNR